MIRWEEIRGAGHAPYKRARVTDGWVVLSGYGYQSPGHIKFFKDPTHTWEGDLIDLE